MGKAKRKPKPSVPNWVYVDRDECWFCQFHSTKKGCGNCGENKEFVAMQKERISKRQLKHLVN